STQVYATGVRSRSEWPTLIHLVVTFFLGAFFSSSPPLFPTVLHFSLFFSL
ncbi:hypothetical protein, partial [Escherichia coli]|uniref:hypothetical protein n=1 Tax=Escherichia coli TaxID=562 RepID=UPI001FCCDB2C